MINGPGFITQNASLHTYNRKEPESTKSLIFCELVSHQFTKKHTSENYMPGGSNQPNPQSGKFHRTNNQDLQQGSGILNGIVKGRKTAGDCRLKEM